MGWFRSVMVGLALFGASGALLPARAQTAVDLALVIAVGVSASMAPDEQDLQREGYAEAFRDPLVHQAIRDGVIGGQGTFLVPARERAQFQAAIGLKILREASSAPGGLRPLVIPAQSQEVRIDCTSGARECRAGAGKLAAAARPSRQT
ncbi:DUF1194 domain-containing protein [Microvirga sp. M2]|uniref:DUF1194 domain-containing protein n=1 Tax=Microvirga sp. M2 TaxID=3073270 RepID=UPI0039C49703